MCWRFSLSFPSMLILGFNALEIIVSLRADVVVQVQSLDHGLDESGSKKKDDFSPAITWASSKSQGTYVSQWSFITGSSLLNMLAENLSLSMKFRDFVMCAHS